jgi:hypothetical protein
MKKDTMLPFHLMILKSDGNIIIIHNNTQQYIIIHNKFYWVLLKISKEYY